jgi:hypothetical protein
MSCAAVCSSAAVKVLRCTARLLPKARSLKRCSTAGAGCGFCRSISRDSSASCADTSSTCRKKRYMFSRSMLHSASGCVQTAEVDAVPTGLGTLQNVVCHPYCELQPLTDEKRVEKGV